MTARLHTWGGSHAFTAQRLAEPRELAELQDLVAASARIHAIGTRHSFNDIADTEGTLVSLRQMAVPVEITGDRKSVWAPASWSYAALAAALEPYDLALPNTGSLPHISIGGACAVGTHGSGDGNRILSAGVTGLEVVTADGDLRRVLQDDPDFPGWVVALGALGVTVRLRLSVVPAYRIRQDVYLALDWGRLDESLAEVFAAGYSVSLFATSWGGPSVDQVWIKQIEGAEAPGVRWGATRVPNPAAPIGDPRDATEQSSPGPWIDRLPHVRKDRVLHAGAEIQSEYFVARTNAAAALAALRDIAHAIDPVLLVSELRSVASDELWMSPCRERESVAIHFTFSRDPERVRAALTAIEEALAPFEARPHWGKWFMMDRSQVAAVTPGAQAFTRLHERVDPEGVFRNQYLERVLGIPA